MTDFRQQALDYHAYPTPGKISVELTTAAETSHDLSLAYSPGVAEPVRAIAENPDDVYKYTGKGNTVAVITNGTKKRRSVSARLSMEAIRKDLEAIMAQQ